MKMEKKKNADVARRAWNILRLALLWARKDKAWLLKRRLTTELRLLPKLLKSLRHLTADATPRDGTRHSHGNGNGYGERQMSFDRTPVFPSVKLNGGRSSSSSSSSMRFLQFPCLNTPVVDFDYDYDFDLDENDNFKNDVVYDYDIVENSEDDIDSRAEAFIAQFYAQMKMQGQISYLH